MANTSILNAFERMWQHTVAALNNKSDKFYVDELASELKIYKQPEEPSEALEGALWVDMDEESGSGGSGGGSMPDASGAPEGAFLRAVNGAATWSTVPNAEEATF